MNGNSADSIQDVEPCPTSEQLSAILTGTDPIADRLALHVATCNECQTKLDRLSDTSPLIEIRNRLASEEQDQDLHTFLGSPLRNGDIGSLDRLAIESLVGSGGMGIVFRGFDQRLERAVAVKVLKHDDHPRAKARFAREAKAASQIQHDHVVPVYSSGHASDGRPYLVMPLIDGESLKEQIARGQLDIRTAAGTIREVALGLSAAHSAGLVHRDVKPANILLDHQDKRAKLTDFGLVRASTDETLTQANVLCGTPEYMSPELIANPDNQDPRSDIYSLGVTLYECLTGTPPFRGKPMEVLEQHRNDEPKPLARLNRLVPRDLETISLKALAKDPNHRYESAAAFANDLQLFLEGRPILARPVSRWKRARMWCRRNSALAGAVGLIFLTLLAGVIASTSLWQRSEANAKAAGKLATELAGNQVELKNSLEIAQSERQRAQQRFNDVRQLANALLFEIYPQIENMESSLAARESIVKNSLQYLDELFQEAEGDRDLQSELATAYEKIGDIQGALSNSSLGNTQQGLDNYRKAQQLRAAVYLGDPTDLEVMEKLANNTYTVARTLWLNSQTAEAEIEFEKGIRLRRDLVAHQPDSLLAHNRLATILIDAGAIPLFNGELDKAIPLYEEAQEILENLIRTDPSSSIYQKTLTRLLRSFGRAKGKAGDAAGGIHCFRQAIEINRGLVKQLPDDFPVQRSAWLTVNMLGELYIDVQDGPNALNTCLSAIDFPKGALEREPENGVVAFDLAISYFNLARSYRLVEDYLNTIAQAEKAREVMAKLATKNPDDLEYQRNLAIYELEIAKARLKLDQPAQVIESSQHVIDILIPITQSDPASIKVRYDLAMAYRIAATAHHQLGEKTQALDFVELAINIVQELDQKGILDSMDQHLLEELVAEKAEYDH